MPLNIPVDKFLNKKNTYRVLGAAGPPPITNTAHALCLHSAKVQQRLRRAGRVGARSRGGGVLCVYTCSFLLKGMLSEEKEEKAAGLAHFLF
jgi:hypothetical protein